MGAIYAALVTWMVVFVLVVGVCSAFVQRVRRKSLVQQRLGEMERL